ncbi:unnamed protein product [Prorocentrum cordatum]|uniref:Calmodulin-lysine N-methyltransferase n=1 Tax=Prorocentrum cordatum TaxID=2364126 RepID=A0ABN9VG70_9DINO|nr:unnamed protein product [Polarella glacialis]
MLAHSLLRPSWFQLREVLSSPDQLSSARPNQRIPSEPISHVSAARTSAQSNARRCTIPRGATGGGTQLPHSPVALRWHREGHLPNARVLLALLEGLRDDWSGVSVVELGAGTGAVSVALGKLGARVVATDYDVAVLKNLRRNIHLNGVTGQVKAMRWDWEEDPPADLRLKEAQCCVGSELAFGASWQPLCTALCAVKAASPGAQVLLVLHEREGSAVRKLHEACGKAGLNPRSQRLEVTFDGNHPVIVALQQQSRDEGNEAEGADDAEEPHISLGDIVLFQV